MPTVWLKALNFPTIYTYARLNLDTTESLEAEKHLGTYMYMYISVIACCLDDVSGRLAHGNAVGYGHRDLLINTLAT